MRWQGLSEVDSNKLDPPRKLRLELMLQRHYLREKNTKKIFS